jgi:hypothetical protein
MAAPLPYAQKHPYMLAFPILLILGFIALLVLCSVKKYSKADLNWLLVIIHIGIDSLCRHIVCQHIYRLIK